VSSPVHQHDHDLVGAPLEVFDRTIEVNLRGLLLATRAAISLMGPSARLAGRLVRAAPAAISSRA